MSKLSTYLSVAVAGALVVGLLTLTHGKPPAAPVRTAEHSIVAHTAPLAPRTAPALDLAPPTTPGDDQVIGDIDPRALGYDSVAALNADLRRQLRVPDELSIMVVSETRHGKEGIGIALVPRGHADPN